MDKKKFRHLGTIQIRIIKAIALISIPVGDGIYS